MSKRTERVTGKTEYKTLDDVVASWRQHFGVNGKHKHMRDEVVELCAQQKYLSEAIERAVLSKRPNGKMHHHQSKVLIADRLKFGNLIRTNISNPLPKSFDELYDLLETLAPKGIGPVTVYDVATRIGAYLKLEPDSLYLHAGPALGWARLGLATKGIKRVERKHWPKALRKMPADEVEDMICAYRDSLHPGLIK